MSSNETRALLARIEGLDGGKEIAQELARHISALERRQSFGLNFERHMPESVALTGRPVSVGNSVRFLAPRGKATAESAVTWRVTDISGEADARVATLVDPLTGDEATRALDDLVYVADFRDPIYPGLRRSDEPILRGGDKPFHSVINAENFHALEAMLFTCQGKVDAIYIDPPYNTGAKDWKYNNDFVDGEDTYRHSKWLSFMERRLKVAKRLLNPRDSVLIVTIDEKEVLRLGLLLEQVFPGVPRQMTTIVINPNGVARGSEMARVEEYAFFLFFGAAGPTLVADSLLDTEPTATVAKKAGVRWEWLMRGGSNSRRQDRPNLFFPIYIDPDKRVVTEVGDPIALSVDRRSIPDKPGLVTVWPVRTSGEEANWRASSDYLRTLLGAGHARVGAYDAKNDRWSLLYLGKAQIRRIEAGDIVVTGKRDDGSLILESASAEAKRTPKTVWNRSAHKAGEYGSVLIKRFTGGRPFPFPKSLYAVEDALRIAVGDKPDALVLDFFAGSGTTAHAVMRLNRQDGGSRTSISVTNNEVSVDEQAALHRKRLRQGDPEWEALGICDFITKPRIRAAVTGETPDGKPVKGDYKFVDEFPMAEGFEENVEFFTLTYENPALVELDLAFEAVAPLLWMRAGSRGRRIERRTDTFDIAEAYAVLFDVDASADFLAAIETSDGLRIAFIVTDDEGQYQAIASELPAGLEAVRLYENYLQTFQINAERV